MSANVRDHFMIKQEQAEFLEKQVAATGIRKSVIVQKALRLYMAAHEEERRLSDYAEQTGQDVNGIVTKAIREHLKAVKSKA